MYLLYHGIVQGIRDGLRHAFAYHFELKAGYLNPVEWRPREFNSPPDTICNRVLSRQMDITDLSYEAALAPLRNGCSLQIHCDGGFRGGVGAASFVVHLTEPGRTGVKRLGYHGVFLPHARSPFHAEIVALHEAVNWIKTFIYAWRRYDAST